MQVEQARALVERDDEELAATLDVPMGPPSRALVKSLTTEMDYLPLDRKVRIAAFLARHGYIITFDGRFEKFCRSERYTQNVHATNVELHQLQDRLGLIGVEVPLADLPKEVAAFHKALLGQNPLIQDMVSHTLENETNRTFIHVGANDLRGSDDQAHHWLVRSPDWKCFLVEPQPRVFERLKKSVRDTPNVTLINAAVNVGGKASHDVGVKTSQSRMI